jgi:hypothetical protein
MAGSTGKAVMTTMVLLVVAPFLFFGVVCGGCAACVVTDNIVNGGPRPPDVKKARAPAKKPELQTFE